MAFKNLILIIIALFYKVKCSGIRIQAVFTPSKMLSLALIIIVMSSCYYFRAFLDTNAAFFGYSLLSV